MKIMLVCGSLPPMRCGVGDYTASLAAALHAHPDVDISVLTSRGVDPGHFPFEVLPAANGWRFDQRTPLMRVVKSVAPRLVHYQYPSLGYQPGAFHLMLPTLLRLSGIPVVQTWHEYQRDVLIYHVPNIILPGKRIVVRPRFLEEMPAWVRVLNTFKDFRLIPNASSIPRADLDESERIRIRGGLAAEGMRVLAYFGFVFAHKGLEDIFTVSDPATDHLLLICELNSEDEYHRKILRMAADRSNVTITGFVAPEEAARLLAVADAVVLPFRDGGGNWNSSIHAATAQGTFVVSTSMEPTGYDEALHTYFTAVGDVESMRQAIDTYAGTRLKSRPPQRTWESVAEEHVKLYREILGR